MQLIGCKLKTLNPKPWANGGTDVRRDDFQDPSGLAPLIGDIGPRIGGIEALIEEGLGSEHVLVQS